MMKKVYASIVCLVGFLNSYASDESPNKRIDVFCYEYGRIIYLQSGDTVIKDIKSLYEQIAKNGKDANSLKSIASGPKIHLDGYIQIQGKTGWESRNAIIFGTNNMSDLGDSLVGKFYLKNMNTSA